MTTTGGEQALGAPQLPNAFQFTSPQPRLCYQGAEAILYKTTFPIQSSWDSATKSQQHPALPCYPAFLKHRPIKTYRHPVLDAKLTRHRILAEARVLTKLGKENVPVPAVYALDWENGWMLGEWIDGETIRSALDREVPLWLENVDEQDDGAQGRAKAQEHKLVSLMNRVGVAVGRMHEVGVVHGDLTTSNLMLKLSENGTVTEGHNSPPTALTGDVMLIDFGLASQSFHDEDRAVDLYVLERAFGSTHPRTESLFEEVLKAYERSYKAAKISLKRLEEVRMRGRKKIAFG